MTSKIISQKPPVHARWATSAVFFLNGFAISNWFVRIPAVSEKLGLSLAALGIVLLASAIGALAAMPIAGRLCAKYGSKPVTTFLSMGFALSVVFPALASSTIALVVALFVWGALNAGLDVAMNTNGTSVEHAYNRPVLSSFHALWSVGSLAGAAVGGLFAAADISIVIHLLWTAAIVFAGFVIASRFLIEDHYHLEEDKKEGLKLSTGLLALGGVAFCALLGEGAVGDWSTLFMKNSLGASAGLAAAGYATFQLAMAIFRFAGDALRTRLGDARVVWMSGIVASSGLAIVVVFNQIWSAIIGFGLVGVGVAVIFPAALGLVSKIEKRSSGPAIAWVASVGYAGFLVGPPLIGLIANQTSLRFGLMVVMLAGFTISLLSNYVKPSGKG